jgi:hypothetical protein
MKSSVHGAIVVVAICSWFAISNHCVFASLATNDTASRECPFHSKPAKQEKPSTGAQCCKILRAVTAVLTKIWSRDDAKFSNAGDCWRESAFTITDSQRTPAPLLLDRGPPNAHSFAELILQRSLFAHAPPVFV